MSEVCFEVTEDDVYRADRAEILSEKLFGFAAGQYPGDVRLLRQHRGVSEEWLAGTRALAEVIEDACVGALDVPVPLEGKAATAMLQVLRLSYLDPTEKRGLADLRNELERVA